MPANSQPWLVQGSLALATLAIAVASLCFGQYPLSLSAVGHTLVHLPPGEGVIGQIVWSVRLPRVVMALLVGGALGLCGATLQGVFQNPLVDPHIIGVTAGSAFGGTLAILLGGRQSADDGLDLFLRPRRAGADLRPRRPPGAGQHAGADSVRDHSQRLLRRAGQPDAVPRRQRRDVTEHRFLAARQLRDRQLA